MLNMVAYVNQYHEEEEVDEGGPRKDNGSRKIRHVSEEARSDGGTYKSPLYSRQLDLATPKPWQSLVPKDILQEVAAEHVGDVGDGKLTAPVHFWLLLVGVLSKNCSSLKDLIAPTRRRFGRVLGWPQGGRAPARPSRRLAAQRRPPSRLLAEPLPRVQAPLHRKTGRPRRRPRRVNRSAG